MKRKKEEKKKDARPAKYYSQGVPHRVTLDGREIVLRMVDGQHSLQWDDIPEYGYAVTPAETFSPILLRDREGNLLCLLGGSGGCEIKELNDPTPGNSKLWMHNYVLYSVTTSNNGTYGKFRDYRTIASPSSLSRTRWDNTNIRVTHLRNTLYETRWKSSPSAQKGLEVCCGERRDVWLKRLGLIYHRIFLLGLVLVKLSSGAYVPLDIRTLLLPLLCDGRRACMLCK
jgi:hypothetical protein